MKVLVTGSAGAVGTPVCRALREAGHTVRGFDARPTPNVNEPIIADLTDAAAVDESVAGVDQVIHLAAVPTNADFETVLMPINIVGTHRIFDTAARHGVKRVIMASTTQVVAGNDRPGNENTITADDRPTPVSSYGLGKLWAEEMGEMYSRTRELSVIMVRIGWLVRGGISDARHMLESGWTDTYLSFDDAGRFFRCAVQAQDVPFAVLFATSNPPAGVRPRYDLDAARTLIGYQPRDTWPDGLPWSEDEIRGEGGV